MYANVDLIYCLLLRTVIFHAPIRLLKKYQLPVNNLKTSSTLFADRPILEPENGKRKNCAQPTESASESRDVVIVCR